MPITGLGKSASRGKWNWLQLNSSHQLVELNRAATRAHGEWKNPISFLKNIATTPYAKAALREEEQIMRAAVKGTRDTTCHASLFNLYQLVQNGQIDRATVDDTMRAAALSTGFTDGEFEKKQRNAWARASDKPRAREAGTPSPPAAVDPLAGLITADELEDHDYGDLVVHIPNMLTAGYSILGGSPKVGKSWLVLDLALACATGGLALGSVSVEPRAVLYLALEDGKRRIQQRKRVLKHGSPKNLNILTELQPGWSGVATIEAWLERHAHDDHPPLVIVDTLATIQPTVATNSSNAYQVDYEFGRRLKATADQVPGAAILAVHHNRKGDALDFIHKLSGSVGVTAACDCILALARDRGSNQATLSVTGKDLAREDDYSLVREGALWTVNGADMEEAAGAAREQRQRGSLGDRTGEVLALIEERGQAGKTTQAADIATLIPADQASSYLGRLFKAARVQKVRRGTYFPVGMMYVETAESLDAVQ